jgi:uncharacterized protein YbjT (DUF2867 family)
MIVITTPTGDIGHRVLAQVVKGQESVRVIARNPSRIPQDIRDRVEIIEGSHSEPAVIEKALTGADSLFWLVPPDTSLDSVDEAYVGFTKPAAEAIKKTGLRRVVVVSAIGSGWMKPAGLVTSSIKADAVLASTGVALRVLAMPSFMDNLLGQTQTIKEKGVFFTPIHADLRVPTVATSDIAAVAASFLLDPTWSGQAEVPVLGPEDLSPNDMANILSEVLGRSVRCQQTTIESFKERMAGFGMSEAFATGYAEMMKAKNEGLDNSVSRSVAAATPTTFRQWCETVLKPDIVR